VGEEDLELIRVSDDVEEITTIIAESFRSRQENGSSGGANVDVA
jgi:hypothetical protein